MKKKFKCEVDCAVCAQKLEDALKKVDGVSDVKVNFLMQKMTLEAPDEIFDDVYDRVVKAASKADPDTLIG